MARTPNAETSRDDTAPAASRATTGADCGGLATRVDGDAERTAVVARRLEAAYGNPRHHNKREPLAELAFILLSAATPEHLYLRTYAALRAAYPRWAAVARAPIDDLAAVLAPGGLARKKAAHLQAALARIAADRGGRPSLAFLRALDDATAEAYLRALPGVGVKTARCVLMYALGRAVLPVDTHVWRVSVRLGFAAGDPLAQPTAREQDRLQAVIPPALRYGLHVNMVAHGRVVCRAPRPGRPHPRCPACGVRDLCPSARAHYPDLPSSTVPEPASPMPPGTAYAP